ncbi:MAG: hypothetical protein WC073_13465, partial [Sterolibacterium sp.]
GIRDRSSTLIPSSAMLIQLLLFLYHARPWPAFRRLRSARFTYLIDIEILEATKFNLTFRGPVNQSLMRFSNALVVLLSGTKR